jgi:5-methylcytosine-specific restriction endonuclease McrA
MTRKSKISNKAIIKNLKKKHKRNKKYKKATIPKAIREQTWIKTFGGTFNHKCYISWCTNEINVFDFHVGHDKPESKGGTLSVDNLKPICARCNLSMSNNYTIEQWNNLNGVKRKWWRCCF